MVGAESAALSASRMSSERSAGELHSQRKWPAIHSLEAGRGVSSFAKPMEDILRLKPSRQLEFQAKDGGAGGSCNLTIPD